MSTVEFLSSVVVALDERFQSICDDARLPQTVTQLDALFAAVSEAKETINASAHKPLVCLDMLGCLRRWHIDTHAIHLPVPTVGRILVPAVRPAYGCALEC
jgi:hypothetical protein